MKSSINISRRTVLGAAAAALAASSGNLLAQAAWPTKPIRLVLGYAPGGGSDVMARAVGQPLTESLGQSVVVDNKPGASGNIATTEVARAAPDGYTFLLAPTTQVTANPYLYKMSINPRTDLVPVAGLGRFPHYLVTRQGLPFKTVKELVEFGRANPGKLTYAITGQGASPHLVAEAFLAAAKITAVQVPYRGSGPALQAMLASEVDFVMDPGIAAPHVQSGKLNILAVASAKRTALFPEVPTFIEAGMPEMEFDAWVGVWAPTGTPAEVISRMGSAISQALTTAPVKTRFSSLSAEALYMDSNRFRDLIAREEREYSALIKKLDIKI
jgi:tripartite-type tricarboxylate transporter receptor subunit TctC